MTATDLDFKTKSYLLTFISKLSTTRHTAPPRRLEENNNNNNNNSSTRNPRKRLSDSHLYQSPRCREERQEFFDQPANFESQYTNEAPQQSRRSPLSNIQNMRSGQNEELVKGARQNDSRGVKRSRTESYEKENIKRSKTDGIRQKNTDHSTQQLLQPTHKVDEGQRNTHSRPSVLVPTTIDGDNHHSKSQTATKPMQFQPPSIEKLDFQFQSNAIKTLPKNCSINTNIAVIQQNADGKFTKISNIPLKALIGNLDVFKQSDIISNIEQRKNNHAKHKQDNQTKRKENTTSQHNQQTDNFSYMKLLQEETIDHELLKTNNTQQQLQHEIAPLHTKGEIISLPPLNAFLNE